jgi:hypothetical protein
VAEDVAPVDRGRPLRPRLLGADPDDRDRALPLGDGDVDHQLQRGRPAEEEVVGERDGDRAAAAEIGAEPDRVGEPTRLTLHGEGDPRRHPVSARLPGEPLLDRLLPRRDDDEEVGDPARRTLARDPLDDRNPGDFDQLLRRTPGKGEHARPLAAAGDECVVRRSVSHWPCGRDPGLRSINR